MVFVADFTLVHVSSAARIRMTGEYQQTAGTERVSIISARYPLTGGIWIALICMSCPTTVVSRVKLVIAVALGPFQHMMPFVC